MATPGIKDIYVRLASRFFKTAADEDVTDKMREHVEALVHGIILIEPETEQASFVSRFVAHMDKSDGVTLTADETDEVEGILDALNFGSWIMDPDELSLGVYDHFKGGIYMVRGFSSWASGNGERVVEYTSLIHGTHHTRLADQWCEVVQWPDGMYRSRFVYRSPDLTTPAPGFKVPSPKV